MGIDSVEANMVRFKTALDKVPEGSAYPRAGLEDPSLALAHAIQIQTRNSWNVKLSPLERAKQLSAPR